MKALVKKVQVLIYSDWQLYGQSEGNVYSSQPAEDFRLLPVPPVGSYPQGEVWVDPDSSHFNYDSRELFGKL